MTANYSSQLGDDNGLPLAAAVCCLFDYCGNYYCGDEMVIINPNYCICGNFQGLYISWMAT